MNNAVTSLKTFGYKTLQEVPFGEIDAVLIASLSYVNLSAYQEPVPLWKVRKDYFARRSYAWVPVTKDEAALDAMGSSERYANSILIYPAWLKDQMTFSCFALLLEDHTLCISFRGLLGDMKDWHNAFCISNGITKEEIAAKEYLDAMMDLVPLPVRLAGHSFGSNLALYSAMCSDKKERIQEIWSLDGVGIYPEYHPKGYAEILPKVKRILPEYSVIGRLFDLDVPCHIVKSTAKGYGQHGMLTWITDSFSFVEGEQFTPESTRLEEILNHWITKTDRLERKIFIHQFFEVMEKGGLSYFEDFVNAGTKEKLELIQLFHETDPITRKEMLYLALLVAGAQAPKTAASIRNIATFLHQKREFIQDLKYYYEKKSES